jgi:DNA-3-methyladenine glycosylase I
MAAETDRSRRGAVLHADGKKRCAWCNADPLYIAYHDDEWGLPLHDDGRLFEMLCLEGAQAGLSWLTILRKRENYRGAFDGFDAEKMARYGARRRSRLLQDAGIVRNRLKLAAFIGNARAYLALRETGQSFDHYLWQFTDGRSLRLRPRRLGEVRTSSRESDAMSRSLKALGFSFVGTTICYAFMQAVGIVDEHQHQCWAAASRERARQEPKRKFSPSFLN